MRTGWVKALGALGLAGCTASADVVGRVGTGEELYRGRAVGGMDGRGSIEMANPDGNRCVGLFRYRGTGGGVADFSCSDGRYASVQFNSLGMSSGYGYGTASDGSPISFAYGLSEEESKRYIAAAPRPASRPAAKKKGSGTGTGFFVSQAGHVLSNHHVIGDCARLHARLPDGTRHPASLIASDARNDLAVAKLPVSAPAVAAFADSSNLRPGDSIVVFGFPISYALASTGNLTTGTVSALAGTHNDSSHIQISAPIQPGNSGGPVADTSGTIAGVIVSSYSLEYALKTMRQAPQNINFAIKDVVAKDFLRTHHVTVVERKRGAALGTAEIGDAMRAYTVFLECGND
jgi:S1-C subfamily serine protease